MQTVSSRLFLCHLGIFQQSCIDINCFHYIQLFNYNHLIVFPVGTFMKRMLTCNLPNVLCVKIVSKMSSK